MRNSLFFAAIIALAAAPAAAQDKPATPPQVKQVIDCRAITEAEARLQCFDRAVATLATAVSAGDVIAADRATIAKERRSLFGLSLPKLTLFGGDEGPKEITAKVRSASEVGVDKYLVGLDDGSFWRTVDTLARQGPPRPGYDVVIKRSPLGTYMMSIENGRSTKVNRVQ